MTLSLAALSPPSSWRVAYMIPFLCDQLNTMMLAIKLPPRELCKKPLCVHLKQLLWYNVPFIATFTNSYVTNVQKIYGTTLQYQNCYGDNLW
ncbi:hypothetical protein DY000_02057971 [Brassica cretica]|uniref:Uncharacterized protein n=1 Tax=Brassica cretica TaxID=69181 RepID=A0ABQ7AJY1_BRACR|nr:hypothetical protein DY000_02057971 [Brassica cretica]